LQESQTSINSSGRWVTLLSKQICKRCKTWKKALQAGTARNHWRV